MSLIGTSKGDKDNVPDSLPETILDRHTQELNEKIRERKKREIEEDNKRLPLSLKKVEYKEKKESRVRSIINQKENKASKGSQEQKQDKDINEKPESKSEEDKQDTKAGEGRESKDRKVAEEKDGQKPEFSFFEQLERRFKEQNGQKNIQDHLSNNLVKRMKIYHDSLRKGDFFFLDTDDIEEKIYRKLVKLKELESEWVVRNEQYQETRELLLEKEEEIEQNINELKEMMRSAERFKLFSQRCNESEGFRLSNAILYSPQELLYELEKMPDEVFSHYANNQKNDFANWIEGVFGLSDLAEKIKEAKSREDLIRILKNY